MIRDMDELKPKKDIKLAPRKAGAATNGHGAESLNDTTRAGGQAAAAAEPVAGPQQIDPAVLEKIAGMRTKIHETFGKIVLAFTASPRHRHLSVGDLVHFVLDPLLRDRIAIAHAAKTDAKFAEGNLAGIAIWANVSEEVDARIREQIKAGVFPVRLKPDDWTSGKINWLLDVVAPSPQLATAVIASFKQVIKEGELRIHPLVSSLLDAETLKKMGIATTAARTAEKT